MERNGGVVGRLFSATIGASDHFRLYSIRRAKARKDEKADSSSYYEAKPEESLLVDMKRKEMDVRGGRSKSRGRK